MRFSTRQLKTQLYIFRQKYFTLSTFLKISFTLIVIFLVLPFFLVLIVTSGYQKKLINSVDNIPEELSTAVLISDNNKDNLKYLLDLAQNAYQDRKINYLYIYLIGDSKQAKDSDIEGYLDKIPSAEIKINRDNNTPYDICNSTKDVYNLSKFIVFSFTSTAIRTTFICNNMNLYSKGIIPNVDEDSLGVTSASFTDYLNDINKIFLGFELPLK